MILVVTLLGVLIVSMILERLFMEINPIIWFLGGGAALLYCFMGKGIVSLWESIISFIVCVILGLMIYPKIAEGIGGGIMKGLWVCALFLGRYIIFTIIFAFVIFFLIAYIMKAVKRDMIPGESLIPAMPIITLSVILTFLLLKAMMII